MLTITVYVIRHAEKPEKGSDQPGFTAAGEKDDLSLTIRGWQRAGAWAVLFGSAASQTYLSPDVIYAANPEHGPEDRPPSRRSLETVTPLCDRLGIRVQTQFQQGQEDVLVAEIGSKSETILISWEHKRIGLGLMPAFFGPQPPKNVPAEWDKTRFDVVFKLTRENPGEPWSFEQLLPCLLTGDSDKPMG